MRIAVSVDEDRGLDSVVSHHFGRCPYYLFADVEDAAIKNVVTLPNPFFQQHEPGQVPGFIHENGAQVILTGGMGRRAILFFEQYQIEPVTGAFGTVAQVLKQYLDGGIRGAAACRESIEHAHHRHHHTENAPVSDTGYEKDAGGRLQEEAESLSRQASDAQTRIDRMKSGG